MAGFVEAQEQARPGNIFPDHAIPLYLSSERADVANRSQVLTIQDTAPATQSEVRFLAPGLNVLNVINQTDHEDWFSTQPFDKDMEFTNSADIVLYFSANAQATTVFEVRLLDVYPSGQVQVMTKDSQQFVTALSPVPVRFFMETEGRTVAEGHVLQIEVYAQTANAVIIMQYGGATPSGVAGLRMRWLDTDGDGVSDSDERLENRNPLFPDMALDFDWRDSDGDGLTDSLERNLTTDPSRVDTDGDTYGDGVEFHAGSDPKDRNSVPHDGNRNGLPDHFENKYFGNTTNLNSTVINDVDPLGDPDADGCNNLREAALGTDPTKADTDGDGKGDCDEVASGTDPLSPLSSVSLGPDRRELQAGSGLFALTSILSLFGLLWWKP